MKNHKNPKWWTTENDSAWERRKNDFKRAWEQTKREMWSEEFDQTEKSTGEHATGKESFLSRDDPAYKEVERAYRFGYGARSYYGEQYPEWTDKLERQLQADWRDMHPKRAQSWQDYAAAIRYGWDWDSDDVAITKH